MVYQRVLGPIDIAPSKLPCRVIEKSAGSKEGGQARAPLHGPRLECLFQAILATQYSAGISRWRRAGFFSSNDKIGLYSHAHAPIDTFFFFSFKLASHHHHPDGAQAALGPFSPRCSKPLRFSPLLKEEKEEERRKAKPSSYPFYFLSPPTPPLLSSSCWICVQCVLSRMTTMPMMLIFFFFSCQRHLSHAHIPSLQAIMSLELRGGNPV